MDSSCGASSAKPDKLLVDGYYWVRPTNQPDWIVAFVAGEKCASIVDGRKLELEKCEIGQRIKYPIRPKLDTKWFHVSTRFGLCTFLSRPELNSSTRPKAVFIHGLGRDFSDTALGLEIAEQYADVILMCLPGFEPGKMIENPTIQNIADMFVEALMALNGRNRFLIVGESLGGLVALAMNKHVDRVIAVDPPLSMKDQWPIWDYIRKYSGGSKFFPLPILQQCLGGESDDVPMSYLDILGDDIKGANIVCGDVPLMPRRQLSRVPSLVKQDEVEQLRNRGAVVEILSGGHDLLREAPGEIERIVVRELRSVIEQP